MVTAHVGARFSCFFHILFTSRTLQNLHGKALCLWKNQMWKKVLEKKNRKEKQAQTEKERVPLSNKEKNSFVKTTCTSGASRWHLDFEQRSSC